MKDLKFDTAYTYIQANYGLNIDQLEFQTVGRIAYDKIGNKNTKINGFMTDVINGEVSIPCNILSIEAVFANFPDIQKTSNTRNYPQPINSFIERYIEYWKTDRSLLYDSGKLLTYTVEDGTLKFDLDYKNILVLYREEIVDEEGKPFISAKEAEAIAAYCAYSNLFKKSIATNNSEAAKLAMLIKSEWARLCELARTPTKISQNQMDDVLNIYTSFDRKTFGKSFKPIR